jgi:hypothetical protein
LIVLNSYLIKRFMRLIGIEPLVVMASSPFVCQLHAHSVDRLYAGCLPRVGEFFEFFKTATIDMRINDE